MTIRQEIGDKAGEGTTLNNIAAIYYESGQLEQARQYFQQALTIFQDIQSPNAEVVQEWLDLLNEQAN